MASFAPILYFYIKPKFDVPTLMFIMQWLQSISLENLEFLNLNACQKISDKGIEAVTSLCPNLQRLAIYWIVGYISYWMFTSWIWICSSLLDILAFCCLRLTDSSIGHITKNCKQIVDLNLSGCKVACVFFCSIAHCCFTCSFVEYWIKQLWTRYSRNLF